MTELNRRINLDQNAIAKIFRGQIQEEVKQAVKPLVEENTKLRGQLDRKTKDNDRLNAENEELRQGIELAIEYISNMHQNQGRDILSKLGIDQFSETDETKMDETRRALRRAARIVHPDAHPDEPPLVKKALGFVVSPINRGLDRLRDKK